MSNGQPEPHSTLALSTKVEEDFVAPLTSVRGALEILRDFEDLSVEERRRFVDTALRGCARLEQGVEELTRTVYAAGERAAEQMAAADEPPAPTSEYASRIHTHDDMDVIEIDFSDFEFSSSQIVNDFYDVIDRMIEETGRDWYFVVNYRDCSIWPEAWVAFAHRGQKVNVSFSLGTVRYEERGDSAGDFRSDSYDPDLFESREAAFARIEEMKQAADA